MAASNSSSCRVLQQPGSRSIQPVAWQSAAIAPLRWEAQKHFGDAENAADAPETPASPTPDCVEESVWLERIEQARQAALAEGVQLGLAQARQAVEEEKQRLSAAMIALAGLRAGLRRAAEADVVRLALAIARRVILREIQLDAGALQALARVALEKLSERDLLRVRVHPALAEMMRDAIRSERGSAAIDVIPDDSLEPGGMLLESSAGVLDASVESQLREIERGFADHLGH